MLFCTTSACMCVLFVFSRPALIVLMSISTSRVCLSKSNFIVLQSTLYPNSIFFYTSLNTQPSFVYINSTLFKCCLLYIYNYTVISYKCQVMSFYIIQKNKFFWRYKTTYHNIQLNKRDKLSCYRPQQKPIRNSFLFQLV